MAPWCIYISCLERAASSGSGRDSVRGSVGAMNAELSRPDGLATVQSGRKQAQSLVCSPGFKPGVHTSGQNRRRIRFKTRFMETDFTLVCGLSCHFSRSLVRRLTCHFSIRCSAAGVNSGSHISCLVFVPVTCRK